MENTGKHSALRELLSKTTASQLAHTSDVVVVKSTDTPYDGFKKLLEHNILSAPVYDLAAKKYSGFLDMRDLVSFVVFVDDDQKSDVASNLNDILIRGCKLLKQPSDGITCTYLSRRNAFHPVKPTDSLLVVSELLAKGLHRVPIVNAEGEVIGIISQSSIIEFLNKHIRNMKDFGSKTIKELGIGTKPVISVKQDTSAIETFRLMDNKKISGVAVVDRDGKFVGNTSASDLKLFIKSLSLELLNEPIMKYLNRIRQESIEIKIPTISCSTHDSLATAIGKLASTKIHKLFVADDEHGYRPYCVLSLTDILNYILRDN